MKHSALYMFGLGLMLVFASAQQPPTTAERARQLLEEAHGRTGNTRAHLEALRREASKQAENAKISDKDRAAVESLLRDADKDNVTEDVRQARIDDFLKTASPQVKEMYLGAVSTSATAGAPKSTAPEAQKAPSAPQKTAGPLKPGAPRDFSNVPPPPPKSLPSATDKAKKQVQRTTIDSDTLTFNKENNRAIFAGNVKLRSAQMDIDCQELEVIFKKDESGEVNAATAVEKVRPTAPAATPGAGPEPVKEEGEQIEKAWARGKGTIVTIVKRSSKGPSICKAGEAFFEEKTGDLTLKIFPEAEQDSTRIQATERGTILILDRLGEIKSIGPTKVIRPDTSKKSTGPTSPAGPGPTPATGTPPTTPPTKPATGTVPGTR